MLDVKLDGLTAGVYLIKITGKSGVYQGKLVKQ
jgi:hypothetical protein